MSDPLPHCVTMNGPTPYERGVALGKQQMEQIRNFVRTWLMCHPSSLGPSEEFARSLVEETGHLAAANHYTPHLVEEVRGMADGADIAFDILFAAQLLDEEWNLIRQKEGPVSDPERCSVVGLSRGRHGASILAQNMDVSPWSEGSQTLTHTRGEGEASDAIVLTFPGYIGLCGLNARGIGLTCNALVDLPYNPDGLPVAFIARRLLESASLDEAKTFLSNINHASGQCYTMVDRDKLISFECCSTSAEPMPAAPNSPATCLHTNHPIWYSSAPVVTSPASPTTHERLAALERRFETQAESYEEVLERTREALSSRDDPDQPVSRERAELEGFEGAINYTYASLIYVVENGGSSLLMASGPPSQNPYRQMASIDEDGTIHFPLYKD